MDVLLADEPTTESKSPTTKFCLPETGIHSAQEHHCSLWAISSVEKYLVGRRQIEAISATCKVRS
jgi:hypothetical protein